MNEVSFDQLPLEWIRAFETAARLGSFTAAAAETGVTQSAISQRIGHLETRLGTRLFLRQARQIGLTPEGEAWLPHVQSALTSLRDSSEALFGVARNRLTLSASSSITELWVVPRLPRLAVETSADITLRTMVVTSGTAKEDDTVRIRYGAGDWPVSYWAPLYDEMLSPVAAPSLLEQGGWQELPRLSVAGPRPGWGQWSERMGTPSTPVPKLRFDTFCAGVAAARAGLGVLLASLPLVEADLTSGALVRVTDQVMAHHETYWLLASKERMSRRQWEQVRGCLVRAAEA